MTVSRTCHEAEAARTSWMALWAGPFSDGQSTGKSSNPRHTGPKGFSFDPAHRFVERKRDFCSGPSPP